MNPKLLKTIVALLNKLGCPFHIQATVGSIGDTLEDDEIIYLLEEYVAGHEETIIWESDKNVLMEIEQNVKRKNRPGNN